MWNKEIRLQRWTKEELNSKDEPGFGENRSSYRFTVTWLIHDRNWICTQCAFMVNRIQKMKWQEKARVTFSVWVTQLACDGSSHDWQHSYVLWDIPLEIPKGYGGLEASGCCSHMVPRGRLRDKGPPPIPSALLLSCLLKQACFCSVPKDLTKSSSFSVWSFLMSFSAVIQLIK